MLVQAGQNENGDSLTRKAEFYSKLYSAAREVKEQKKAIEDLMDRSYHLMMMTKVLKKNPNLSADSKLQDYCRQIEVATNRGEPVQWNEEKAEFQEFLRYARIDAADIGYNPNYKTELRFEQTEKKMVFKGGWMESLFSEDNNIQLGPNKNR